MNETFVYGLDAHDDLFLVRVGNKFFYMSKDGMLIQQTTAEMYFLELRKEISREFELNTELSVFAQGIARCLLARESDIEFMRKIEAIMTNSSIVSEEEILNTQIIHDHGSLEE